MSEDEPKILEVRNTVIALVEVDDRFRSLVARHGLQRVVASNRAAGEPMTIPLLSAVVSRHRSCEVAQRPAALWVVLSL